MQTPHFSAASYLQLFVRSGHLPPAQLLAGSGLDEGQLRELDYVDAKHFAVVLRNFDRIESGGAWAARFGARLGVATHGPLGFAALSAPTLGAALQVLAQFHAVRINSVQVNLRREDPRYVFGLQDLTGMDDYARWITEITLKVIQALIETVVGHPLGENVAIQFTCSDPGYAGQLQQVYGVACRFDAAETCISMPASWWDIRSPFYDEAVYRSNTARCREIVAALAHDGDPLQRVQNQLARHFDQVLAGQAAAGKPPGLAQLAEQLHITTRTLIRRLKEADSSYKQLLEAAQKQCVELLLRQANLSIADVALRMGYQDPANFGRAFRLWYGVSPAAWRRGQGGK